MSSDLLAQIMQSLIEGDPDLTVNATRQALAAGLEPLAIIAGGLIPGMRIVGERFSCGEYFLPNLIVSANGMKQAMQLLDPELKARRQAVSSPGSVVIGTVHGDIHEIGKSLVATMLSAHGFEVHDLGSDVPLEAFVTQARQTGSRIVAASALLTTTMTAQRDLVRAVEAAGLPSRPRVLVGGAPTSAAWAAEIGAIHAENALGAVKAAEAMVR